ncbi:M28 family peptidase [bacterium]|nr:M28 family peptidase [bacterium]
MRRLLIFVSAVFLVSGCSKKAKKEAPSFGGDIAYEYLTAQVELGTREPGSEGHEKAVDFFRGFFQKYCKNVKLQRFSFLGYNGQFFPSTNFIISFRPEDKDRILLCAHWDTRPRSENDPDSANVDTPTPGANDGASGVAILMRLAEIMHKKPPPIGVDIVLFDAEDYGYEGDYDNYLLGSRYFARNLGGYRARFGILLDMVGDKDLSIKKERYSLKYASDVVDLIWKTAEELGIEEFENKKMDEYIIDDHLPLNEAGIKTVDIIDFDYPWWHTSQDTPDKCSPESLEKVGQVILKIIYEKYDEIKRR